MPEQAVIPKTLVKFIRGHLLAFVFVCMFISLKISAVPHAHEILKMC